MTKKILLPLLLAGLAASGCNTISSLVHDDQVVAKVGGYKLYRSQLSDYLPDGITPEDSVNLSMRYIRSWATELLYLKVAEEQLSKGELDVTPELEDYRRSLLKYRYEQRYINDRLDTLITPRQMEAYYAEHQSAFTLERPIMKVRFVSILKDAPARKEVLRCLGSTDPGDQRLLDSLTFSSALRYFDSSDRWMDAAVLAREFGTDYATMLSRLKDDRIEMDAPDRGDIRVMQVFDIRRSGVAPIEYCADGIRDNILSQRKRDLLDKLEQDLLTDAMDSKNFVIY